MIKLVNIANPAVDLFVRICRNMAYCVLSGILNRLIQEMMHEAGWGIVGLPVNIDHHCLPSASHLHDYRVATQQLICMATHFNMQ